MSNEKCSESWSPGSRRPRILQTAELALRLIRRAEKQHEPTFRIERRVRTGLRALDDLRGLWWGLTVIHGGGSSRNSDHVSLAARIALETARGGAPVLWLSLDGYEETPVFRLLTGIARIPVRNVFVDTSLGPPQWEALETVRAELASLPLRVGDAHGLTMEELRASCLEAARAERLALLVVDGIDDLDAPLLTWLERLSLDMDVPTVAVVTTPAGTREEAVGFTKIRPCPLIRSSPVLHVRRERSARDANQEGLVPLLVDVLRMAEPDVDTVELRLNTACRWLEDVVHAAICADTVTPKHM